MKKYDELDNIIIRQFGIRYIRWCWVRRKLMRFFVNYQLKHRKK